MKKQLLYLVVPFFILFLIFIFPLSIHLLNNWRSSSFLNSLNEIQLPKSTTILEIDKLFGNFTETGDKCMTIAYWRLNSGIYAVDLYKEMSSEISKNKTVFYWRLFKKEENKYFEINNDKKIDLGTVPDWNNGELKLVVQRGKNHWENGQYILIFFSDIDEFPSLYLWDLRCC